MFSLHISTSVVKTREPEDEQLCITVYLAYIISMTLTP